MLLDVRTVVHESAQGERLLDLYWLRPFKTTTLLDYIDNLSVENRWCLRSRTKPLHDFTRTRRGNIRQVSSIARSKRYCRLSVPVMPIMLAVHCRFIRF